MYREEHIKELNAAIQGDEFEDLSQTTNGTGGQSGGIPDDAIKFIDLFLSNIDGAILEMGVGSGAHFKNIVITDVIEPAKSMLELFKKRHMDDPSHYPSVLINPEHVVHGVIECMPDEWHDKFVGALFTNGIFQVRSDYEAFIEINRILKIGGVLLFNIYTNDDVDIICGRVLGAQNYIRVVKEFGFELVGRKDNCGTNGITYLCFKKIKNFDFRDLRKLQFVPIDRENKIYKINNLNPIRDWSYL